MDAIIAPGTVPYAQADQPPASGTPGYATGGNPSSSPPVPPTDFPAYHYSGLTKELLTLLTTAGITPSRFNLSQIALAVQTLARGQLQVVGQSGTVTVPVWATSAEIEMWAASGGSGGSAQSSSTGSGSFGGDYILGAIGGLTGGQVIQVVVGIGGVAGEYVNNAFQGPSVGGDSSFGSWFNAIGGAPGNNSFGAIATAPTRPQRTSTIAAPGGGMIRMGESGGTGYVAGNAVIGGPGGGTQGSGSTGVATSNASTPLPGIGGVGPGQGSSSGVSGGGGAQGANGLILVRWKA